MAIRSGHWWKPDLKIEGARTADPGQMTQHPGQSIDRAVAGDTTSRTLKIRLSPAA
jgi:hypothetical protein